jgi:pimeloyl-ACP methyl ester carboxylesterase
VVNQIVRNAPFIDQGKGEPTLVFLHYFGGAANSWQWVIQALEAEFRCVALDLPGFGQQPPLEEPSLQAYSDFVWEALAGLGVDHFVLVGHSMGGKIALQMAAASVLEEPHKVILVAPSPPTQEPMPEEERERLLQHHTDPENAETTVDQATLQPLSDTQRAIAIQNHTLATDSAWRWWLLEGMNQVISDRLRHLKTPVTVVASTDDPVIPFDILQSELIEKLPQAEMVKLSQVGHLLPLEAPERIAEVIHQRARSTETR